MRPAPRQLVHWTLTLLALTLAACTGDRTGDTSMPAAPTNQSTGNAPPASAPPLETAELASTPPAAPVAAGNGVELARFDGYGDLRFGMTAAQAKQAWGGELKGQPGAGETCYYLSPMSQASPAQFAFMIENDKFVRYDVGNDSEVAPGGGQRGMSADQIGGLYTGRVKEQNHKYVPGGKYLRVTDGSGRDGVLLFETDAAGVVTGWRAGVAPQVDYVEGCS